MAAVTTASWRGSGIPHSILAKGGSSLDESPCLASDRNDSSACYVTVLEVKREANGPFATGAATYY